MSFLITVAAVFFFYPQNCCCSPSSRPCHSSFFNLAAAFPTPLLPFFSFTFCLLLLLLQHLLLNLSLSLSLNLPLLLLSPQSCCCYLSFSRSSLNFLNLRHVVHVIFRFDKILQPDNCSGSYLYNMVHLIMCSD